MLATSIILLLASSVHAAHVPVDKARQVAKNFYMSRLQDHLTSQSSVYQAQLPQSIEFSQVKRIKNNGQTLIYAFNRPNNQGYILISADDAAFPFLSYAFKGNYNPSENALPEGFRWFLDNYIEQIGTAIESSIQPFQRTVNAWREYSSPIQQNQVKSVTPLTDSIAWGQGCYFNELCPYDNQAGSYLCNHTPVGCVATAMSIVMKYHSYPSHGSGSETYNSNYGSLSANFDNTIYHWDKMPNQLNSPNLSVATVMYHAGVAVNMSYGPNGSGAIFGHSSHTPTAETALQNHFGFPNANWEVKSTYTFSAWESKLRKNLDSLNPILYAGGIHSFVCDGYQGSSNNHFHFNWGWQGNYNNYAYLNNLVPSGTGTGGGTGNYTNNQQAIFNMVPPKAKPQANFITNTNVVSPGGDVFFQDMSSNVPDNWQWDFGDGNSSTKQYPIHTYSSAGTYNVKLVVTNTFGSDSITKTAHITVQQSSGISANLHTNKDTAYATDILQFSDVSSGNPNAWTWDFDDGSYSYLKTPKHFYNNPGTYNVKMTAADNNGSDTASKTITILPAPMPVADFEADTTHVAAGTNAKFYDLSTNSPNSWEWSFGDGITSTLQNPTHQYQSAGDYTVKLVINNNYGVDSVIKQDYIHIYQAPPVADFTTSATTALDGQSIQFIDQSSGIVNSYHWDFGDGNTATGQYPSHSYDTPGVYTVSHAVANSAGSDTITKTDLITVNGSGLSEQENKSFRAYPNPVNQNLRLEFDHPQEVLAVRLTSMSGETVLSRETPSNREDIRVASFRSGIYFLEVIMQEEVFVEKIIIQ